MQPIRSQDADSSAASRGLPFLKQALVRVNVFKDPSLSIPLRHAGVFESSFRLRTNHSSVMADLVMIV